MRWRFVSWVFCVPGVLGPHSASGIAELLKNLKLTPPVFLLLPDFMLFNALGTPFGMGGFNYTGSETHTDEGPHGTSAHSTYSYITDESCPYCDIVGVICA